MKTSSASQIRKYVNICCLFASDRNGEWKSTDGGCVSLEQKFHLGRLYPHELLNHQAHGCSTLTLSTKGCSFPQKNVMLVNRLYLIKYQSCSQPMLIM